MNYKDFEDFLAWKFAKIGTCVLDDDFPDSFDDWLCQLEVDDWLKYGDAYAKIKESKCSTPTKEG